MPNKKIKIIALPYAGANGYCYREFENLLSNNFEWITYELPGRGNRIDECLLLNIKDIVYDLYNKMISEIEYSNYIIYGHSMGTILGFELMKKIISSESKEPMFLFFTGRGAPNIYEKEKLAGLEKESFWKKLKETRGVSDKLFKNDEFKNFFEPILRADFKACEDYSFIDLKNPLKTPIYLGIGNEELIGRENDKIKWNEILAWQNITELSIRVKFYKGDHFFILDQTEMLVKDIEKASLEFTIP